MTVQKKTTPLLNISPSPLHRLPPNRVSRKWRRRRRGSPRSKLRSVITTRRLRVITRRIQTRLILCRPHARDAVRPWCRSCVLLAVKRLWGVLAVGIVVVSWRSVGSGLLLAVVVIGIGIVVRRKESLLLSRLGTLHFHVVVWQSAFAACGWESRQGVLVECFVWFVVTRWCSSVSGSTGHWRRSIHRRRRVHGSC